MSDDFKNLRESTGMVSELLHGTAEHLRRTSTELQKLIDAAAQAAPTGCPSLVATLMSELVVRIRDASDCAARTQNNYVDYSAYVEKISRGGGR